MHRMQAILALHVNGTISLTQLDSQEVRLSQALELISVYSSTSVILGFSATYKGFDVIVSFAPFPKLQFTVIGNYANSEHVFFFA